MPLLIHLSWLLSSLQMFLVAIFQRCCWWFICWNAWPLACFAPDEWFIHDILPSVMYRRQGCFILFLLLFVVSRYTVGSKQTSQGWWMCDCTTQNHAVYWVLLFSTQKDKAYLSLPEASERYILRSGGFEFIPQGFTVWMCGVMMWEVVALIIGEIA